MIYRVLTIGYSNLEIDKLILNLKKHQINTLIDVRSKPFSRFRPDFRRNNLRKHLESQRIQYIFMGDKLGGIPKNLNLYTNGLPDHDKIRRTIDYQKGLDYLEKGLEFGCSMVLLCACSDYTKCHRHNLIGVDLERKGYEVLHILKDGSLTQDRRLF